MAVHDRFQQNSPLQIVTVPFNKALVKTFGMTLNTTLLFHCKNPLFCKIGGIIKSIRFSVSVYVCPESKAPRLRSFAACTLENRLLLNAKTFINEC